MYPFSLLALCVLLLLGCAQPHCTHDANQSATLLRGSWHVTSLQNSPLAANTSTPTLQFFTAQNKISGFSGCNRYMGSYFIKNGFLQFNKVATTMMACSKEKNELETRFLHALNQTLYYCIRDNTLKLSDEHHQEIMTFNRLNNE